MSRYAGLDVSRCEQESLHGSLLFCVIRFGHAVDDHSKCEEKMRMEKMRKENRFRDL
jgi:hypothetical protein